VVSVTDRARVPVRGGAPGESAVAFWTVHEGVGVGVTRGVWVTSGVEKRIADPVFATAARTTLDELLSTTRGPWTRTVEVITVTSVNDHVARLADVAVYVTTSPPEVTTAMVGTSWGKTTGSLANVGTGGVVVVVVGGNVVVVVVERTVVVVDVVDVVVVDAGSVVVVVVDRTVVVGVGGCVVVVERTVVDVVVVDAACGATVVGTVVVVGVRDDERMAFAASSVGRELVVGHVSRSTAILPSTQVKETRATLLTRATEGVLTLPVNPDSSLRSMVTKGRQGEPLWVATQKGPAGSLATCS
jgi:hypothetical protein